MADNKLYLHNIDLATNELLNARIQPVTTATRNALASSYNSNDSGILAYDTTQNMLYVWDGNQWDQVGLTPSQLAQLQYAYDNSVTGVNIALSNPQQATITLTKVNAPSLTDVFERAYVHTQVVPAIQWNITHNLNKFPSVSIVDSSYEEVIGEVEYIDSNNLTVRFTASFSGEAYIN